MRGLDLPVSFPTPFPNFIQACDLRVMVWAVDYVWYTDLYLNQSNHRSIFPSLLSTPFSRVHVLISLIMRASNYLVIYFPNFCSASDYEVA